MSRKYLKVTLLFFSIVLTVLSLFLARFLAEKYFFDKFFLGKSNAHGYDKNIPDYDIVNKASPAPYLLEKRVAEVRYLVNKAQNLPTQEIAAPSDTFTIALIGDSFVYGMGVEMQERIGAQLEKKLNQDKPSKVYNLALSGDSILDNSIKLELAEKYLKPDLSVVVIVENDTYFDYFEKYPGGKDVLDRITPLCPGQIKAFDYTHVVTGDDVTNLVDYPSWSKEYSNSCLLRVIISEMNSKYKDHLFYMSLSRLKDEANFTEDTHESEKHLNEMMKQYVQAVTDSGGKVIFPDESFVYQTVSPTEGHSSASTNAQYADLLYREITANPRWKSK